MRRPVIAVTSTFFAAWCFSGCSTLDGPASRVRPDAIAASDNEHASVPDAVMLGDQVGSHYRDTPVP